MAHDQEVKGLSPSPVYWMGVQDVYIIARYYMSIQENIEKVAEWGTAKDYIYFFISKYPSPS